MFSKLLTNIPLNVDPRVRIILFLWAP